MRMKGFAFSGRLARRCRAKLLWIGPLLVSGLANADAGPGGDCPREPVAAFEDAGMHGGHRLRAGERAGKHGHGDDEG